METIDVDGLEVCWPTKIGEELRDKFNVDILNEIQELAKLIVKKDDEIGQFSYFTRKNRLLLAYKLENGRLEIMHRDNIRNAV